MSKTWLYSLSFLALLAGEPALAQQGPPQVTLGRAMTSQLGPEDPKLDSDQSSYEVYQLRATPGHVVKVQVETDDFVPFLSVGDALTEGCENCRSDLGSPAVVQVVVPADGILLISVNGYEAGDSGSYRLLATAEAPTPLSAQPVTFGQTVSGTLSESAGITASGERAVAYAVRLPAGQNVQLAATSDDFDPKLELYSPAGAKVAEDDDGGPGVSARIRYQVPSAGLYQLRVLAVGSPASGGFQLTTGNRPPVVPMPAPRPLSIGQTVSGNITSATPSYERDGEAVTAVRYALPMVAGQVYRMTAIAPDGSDLDPKVAVGKVDSNDALDSVLSDDDGGGGRNASLRFRPETTGTYVVEVQRVSNTTGAYRLLVVQSAPDRPAGSPRTVALGDGVNDVLRDGDARDGENDTLYRDYRVTLKGGARYVFDAERADESSLDPVMAVLQSEGGRQTQLATDDDGGEGLNARIRFVAPKDGTYLVRVRANSSNQEGAFRFKVSEAAPLVTPPAPSAITIGQVVRGNLDSGDPTRQDAYYYDRYVFSAQAGETYEISAESDDFDIEVGARQFDGEDYVSDDDGGEGTNSKLSYTVTISGRQVIRVTSVNDGATGSYQLRVVRQ
ncbi:hypothetical protein PbB2_00629 [Candidatus Phycosocius bacilliformis]|uniref:Peptidase C-terminal archaeal/bacterial domain-containing protein n=1 Tax=Candidatus Phycosocius bacilliformis TaxID=1445552 RepID=A0A2P2E7D7_9PROT|nr:PPC domain-containing protein [Candidatus Phycosocius bacilliformis]GBF56972.1 hypothetical protein PbB2_00629 [Candidatus Phycosocius bacilliformis]